MLPLLKRAALGEMRVLEAEQQMGDEFDLNAGGAGPLGQVLFDESWPR